MDFFEQTGLNPSKHNTLLHAWECPKRQQGNVGCHRASDEWLHWPSMPHGDRCFLQKTSDSLILTYPLRFENNCYKSNMDDLECLFQHNLQPCCWHLCCTRQWMKTATPWCSLTHWLSWHPQPPETAALSQEDLAFASRSWSVRHLAALWLGNGCGWVMVSKRI